MFEVDDAHKKIICYIANDLQQLKSKNDLFGIKIYLS